MGALDHSLKGKYPKNYRCYVNCLKKFSVKRRNRRYNSFLVLSCKYYINCYWSSSFFSKIKIKKKPISRICSIINKLLYLKGQYTRNFRYLVYCLYEISLLQHNHWYQNYSCTIILHGIKALQSSLSKPVWVNIIIERNATRTALYLKDHSCCISASLVIISNISCLELPLAMRYTWN